MSEEGRFLQMSCNVLAHSPPLSSHTDTHRHTLCTHAPQSHHGCIPNLDKCSLDFSIRALQPQLLSPLVFTPDSPPCRSRQEEAGTASASIWSLCTHGRECLEQAEVCLLERLHATCQFCPTFYSSRTPFLKPEGCRFWSRKGNPAEKK